MQTVGWYWMDAPTIGQHHASVRVLTHIKKLNAHCFGQFLVRVICDCGGCREIEPEALTRLVGWSVTLKQLAVTMRCSNAERRLRRLCRSRGRGRAECPGIRTHKREPRPKANCGQSLPVVGLPIADIRGDDTCVTM